MTDTTEPIASPCIGVCAMNETTGYCHGCFRTIDEIREWWDMPEQSKQIVLVAIESRQTEGVSFDQINKNTGLTRYFYLSKVTAIELHHARIPP